jgi:predicted Zn-dependent protease
MFNRILYNLIFISAAAVSVTGCRSVPYTGRSQLMMSSESSENQMGEEAWRDMCKTTKVTRDPAMTGALNRVGKNIANAAEKPEYNWEFKVFEVKEPNAFCLPGGKVAATTGIFPYFANDAEMAAVVGHEVGHAIARHAGERMSQGIIQSGGGAALSVFTSTAGTQEAYGIVTEVGAMLPYSRTQEYEADHLGMIFMAKAGYNPAAALTFWDKFGKLGSNSRMKELLSTHPVGEKRLQELKDFYPKAMEYYNAAPVKRGLGEVYSQK